MLDIDVLKFDHSVGAHGELCSPLVSQELLVLALAAGFVGLRGDAEVHERLRSSHLAIERVRLSKLAERVLLKGLEVAIRVLDLLLALIIVILPLLLSTVVGPIADLLVAILISRGGIIDAAMDLSLIEIIPPELLVVRTQCTIMCMFVIG